MRSTVAIAPPRKRPSGPQATRALGEVSAMPAWKRAMDITLSLAALPVLALVTLIMTIVMKLVAPGPVFFCQERVGHRGRRFRIYKFRTMYVGADTGVHRAHCEELIHSNAPMVKTDVTGDSRLIPGARLIRSSGLDELPQLINVLRGEMSLVGPRPCLPYEYDQYLPWQRDRFLALPGLTGLWQVSGKNRTTFHRMIRLDIHYARNKSWWLDFRIIAMTIPALLGQIYDNRIRRKSVLSAGWSALPFPQNISAGRNPQSFLSENNP